MELLFLGVLGGRAFAALSGPLLYLYFLVPFGGFLTPALQDFTARFIMHGLDLLGVANYTDGYTIQIPRARSTSRRGARAALPDRLDRLRLPLRAADLPHLAALALTLAPGPAAIGPDLATAGCQADPRAVPVRATIRRYACDGLVLRAETFPAGAAPRLIVGEWARLTRPAGAEDATTWRLPRSDLPWTLTQTSQPPSLAAALLWQGGRPVEPGLRFRLRQAWHTLVGGGATLVLLVLTPARAEAGSEGEGRASLAMASFLGAEAARIGAALAAASPAQ